MALYQNTIDQDLSKLYIRKLEPDEIPSTGWVLPEHGVINPKSQENFVVFPMPTPNLKEFV